MIIIPIYRLQETESQEKVSNVSKKKKKIALARILSRAIVLCFWKEHSDQPPHMGNEITIPS